MSQPRYRQLADTLRADIASGRYPVGGQLPPGSALPREADLAARFGVSLITVRQALRDLDALDALEVIELFYEFIIAFFGQHDLFICHDKTPLFVSV